MLLLPGHSERVRGLAYAPGGRSLASCGSDWVVRVWDLASGSERLALGGHRRNIMGVVYSADGRVLASAGNEPSVRTWDAETGEPLATFASPIGRFQLGSVIEALLGRIGREQATDDDLRAASAAAWRLSTNRARMLTRREADVHRNLLDTFAETQDRPVNETADVLELRVGAGALTLLVPAVIRPRVPRGTFVPGGGFGLGSIRDLEVVFSPDGRSVAETAGRIAWIWPDRKADVAILAGHEAFIMALAFAPDGRTLATGSHDGTVRLWDVATGECRVCLDGEVGIIDAVAFSPDGLTLAAGGKRGIVVWDTPPEWA